MAGPKPVCQIKTYTGITLDHTIIGDASASYKDSVTNAIGTFQVVLPIRNASPISTADPYNDIALFDKVYIYFGYDSIPANPNFIGRIDRITVNADGKTGATRTLSGLGLGEILTRRIKNFWRWTATDACVLVDELADDLLLGVGDIDGTVTGHVTYDANQKTYLTLLQNISDYWISPGVQVKADFKVDNDNDLYWKARPMGTSTETLTVGNNILSYRVQKSLDTVKNKIWVFGAFDKENVGSHFTWVPTMFWPIDENWTEFTTNWTLDVGTSLNTDAANKTTGSNSIDCLSAQPGGPGTDDIASFYRNLKPEMNWMSGKKETVDNSFKGFKFDADVDAGFFTTCEVRALAPDTANYWTWNISLASAPAFTTNTINFDDGSEGHFGTPKWDNIQGFWFYIRANMGARSHAWIDNLRTIGGRFLQIVQDPGGGIGTYGQRDLIYKDETLDSITDVETRANTLLYRLKDPPTQIDLVTTGNTNILSGDRLTLSIPSEGISGAPYDVLSTSHTFSDAGFLTSLSLIDSANVRNQIKTSMVQYLAELRKAFRDLSWNKESY